jgi:hypothetical protein
VSSHITINLYNSTFDQSQVDILNDFNISANVNNQFGWSSPSNYPFKRESGSNYGYDQDLNWLILNPQILAPFVGISTPPNPGLTAPIYIGYATGLFGYLRKDYI